MRLTGLTVLYTALAIGANASFVSAQDFSPLADLKTGDMKKLVLHTDAKPVAQTVFFDQSGVELTLSDFQGKTTVLNLWATWCAPCKKEMPSLNSLAQNMKNESFRIITVASGRNSKTAIDNFFNDYNLFNLSKYRDPKGKMAIKYGDQVRVNAVAPGFFISKQNKALLTNEDGTFTERGQQVINKTPFKRFGKQEEIYGAIHYLLSDASSFVTGTVMAVDGGFSCFCGV